MSLDYQLLLIDPQNDFCDLPPSWCPNTADGQQQRPSLPVPGAHADMQRAALWIRANGDKLDHLTITLDSHQRWDIAHPDFWQKADGQAVAPFTLLTAAQVRAKQVVPREPSHLPRALAYLNALEAGGRYTLMVWPVHCEIGSWGHGLHPDIHAACGDWQRQRQRAVSTIIKGLNPWTEHYNALQAEVPDPHDSSTQLNHSLLSTLLQAKQLVVAGEASSHCVRATMEHLVELAPPGFAQRIVLLTDCMSPVKDFESAHAAMLDSLQKAGARLSTSAEFSL